ncbi:MAG: HlyC/CorC family transporter [Tenericutes bacterium]|nr:HlyC/CorC family transporter [Mycoplasmatota bacterium]
MLPILILIFVLIIINGFFAASEMALVSIKPSDLYRIKSQGIKNAEVLDKVTKDSTKYLSTIQVAITFAGFLSSAFAGSQLSGDFVNLLGKINIVISDGLAVIIITVILSFFTLVLGELVPKRIAMTNPSKFALLCAPFINVFMIIFKPFVWLLSISTEGVIRLLGLKAKKAKDKITEKQIKEMIVFGQIEGLYKTEERDMMNRVFRLDDLSADMIMTHKSDIIALDLAKPNLMDIIDSRYSRIPVINGSKDNIEGVIFVKDLLVELKDKMIEEVDIESLIRKPYIIDENIKINILLKQMRDSYEHLAFILNDSNELEGIITLEDIVEEIVGNIYDEHDFIGEHSETIDEFGYIFDAEILISDIEGKLGIKIDSSEGFDTIGDFVQAKLKDLDKSQQHSLIDINIGSLRVLSRTKNKVKQIELKLDQNKLKD